MTKKKTTAPAPHKPAVLMIAGTCKNIATAIETVGLLKPRGITSHVEGGKGVYLVKIMNTYDESEAGLLIKSLDKAFPKVTWWTNKKEL